jgi:starch-binding outer membrane protein, SusD/RagB family
MKMRNIISFTGAVILLLVSSSCNKDYLDKNPLDAISNPTFWTSKEDVAMAVGGCYSRMYGSMMDYQRGYIDALGEDTYNYWGFFNTEQQVLGVLSSTSGGMPEAVWNGSYRGIAECNFVLDNIDKATMVDAAIINAAKAEARFLRALWYFDLVTGFGDVPLYSTSPKSAEESKIARNPVAEVLTFIEADLDFAIANLPNTAYNKGHAVKASAQGIKARVLIWQQKWAETAAICQEIMNSGLFSIYGDYEGMFLKRGQKNNPEIIFACEYLGPTLYHSVYGMNIEYAKHIFLTTYLRDSYDCTDGLPIAESALYDSTGLAASMKVVPDENTPWKFRENRDPRFKYIIRGPHTNWAGHYEYNFYDVTGVQNRKYIDTAIQGNYTYNYLNDWNCILLRYADILLMYAEAKNEVSGPDASIYAAIDQVHTRTTALIHPGWTPMPPVDQARYNTKDAVRTFIQKERLLEFPMEGLRPNDLKRWKIAHIILPTLKNPGGYQYVFENPKHYLWPIQQYELDANKNLVQTPGY